MHTLYDLPKDHCLIIEETKDLKSQLIHTQAIPHKVTGSEKGIETWAEKVENLTLSLSYKFQKQESLTPSSDIRGLEIPFGGSSPRCRTWSSFLAGDLYSPPGPYTGRAPPLV